MPERAAALSGTSPARNMQPQARWVLSRARLAGSGYYPGTTSWSDAL